MLTSREIYERLITGYGQPDWWPGTPYAIMVTAILVQNTAWSNVEKAVAEMGERLMPEYIDSLTEEELQPFIRSCGFYRAKARYVKALTAWFKGYGYEVGRVREKSLHDVRQELLALPGIGAETADAILTYAFRMPSFVLDAYTRRFLERLGYGFKTDEERRAFLTKGIEPSADMYGWYHWALLEHGKARCGKKPKCEGCVFGDVCRFMD
jgi:endonuclease-3 related protein